MRAGWTILVLGIASLSCGGEFAAGGGQGGQPTGGTHPVGGGPAQGGGSAQGGTSSGVCASPTDCAVPDICMPCWNGDCVSPSADCVQGECIITPGVCPPNPCEGVACGGKCQATELGGYCDSAGTCVPELPSCGCSATSPCAQPPNTNCKSCPSGLNVCQRAVCYNGQCQLIGPRCPCEAMQAAGTGVCTTTVGYMWNGSVCLPVSCACTGIDCPSLYLDLVTCKEKQAVCPVTDAGLATSGM